ncbi:hypothetical protein [Salibaculum sp.]|uniref:hypothetical protein n=1 Tax=Salibaculum sp. TaxID=2855480 RepID=UPI002B4A374E|nr:hypothetical protein [Salibaculum sp.]HKL68915.1 hypothetical protein [Salibaculum sp.]
MKQIVVAGLLALTPLTVTAQSDTPEGEIGEGFSLMEEGARLMFRGILREMEPAMEDVEGMARKIRPALDMLASEMGPALIELMGKLDDVRHYTAPEVLPDGDIIIRRREDAPPYDPDSPMYEPGAEIDL